jgi:hypothetical protein
MALSIAVSALALTWGLARIARAIETHACARLIGDEQPNPTLGLSLAVDNTKENT